MAESGGFAQANKDTIYIDTTSISLFSILLGQPGIPSAGEIKAWEKQRRARFIEVEVRSEDAAIAAAREFTRLKKAGGSRVHDYPCLVMLDNQMPEDVRRIIVALRREQVWDAILVEASGGITETNAELYADAEVDVISLGSLTHSPRALDLSQRPA